MTADTVRDLAYRFLARGLVEKIDSGHNQIDDMGVVVESFIARDSDPDFIPGSWVLGVHIPDEERWGQILKGDYNGFSMEAWVYREQTTMTFDVPELLEGQTVENDGHSHRYVVKFDGNGKFIGGETMAGGTDLHKHNISKGTATDTVKGHNHRFSFLEGVLNRV